MNRFSQAAEKNKEFIAAELVRWFAEPGSVIEVGSGSGQHAAHMTKTMGHLKWQCSEISANLHGLADNILELPHLEPPLLFEAGVSQPDGVYDYGFAANVLHIMPEQLLPDFFGGLSSILADGAVCCIYGPFKYGGEFTMDSNARFDVWLRQNHEGGGIRDIEMVCSVSADVGFSLVEDSDMPANNQLLTFRLEK